MTDPPPSAAHTDIRRAAVLLAMVLLCTLAAWRIVDAVLARNAPKTASALLNGPNPERSAPLRDGSVVPSAAAIARAQSLLQAEPLAADAYVVLGLAAQQAGRDEEAARLMQIAAGFWPRDLLAQTWLLGRALRRRDYEDAMGILDVTTRGRPDTLDALTEAVAPILADKAAVVALADRLDTDPPWRTRFIEIAVRQWREPAGLIALVERLQAKPPGLSARELRPFLAKLLVIGRVDQAYRAWLRSLPGERLTKLTYLYNGRFHYPVSNMPFDWVLPTVPGASATVSSEGEDRILTVGFLGGKIPLPPVTHDLVLSPGSYRLTGRVRTDRLRAERGVRWRLACHEDANGALGASESFTGSAPWRDFTADLAVPDTGCRAQVLSLDVDARTESERKASGIAAFSGLEIAPR